MAQQPFRLSPALPVGSYKTYAVRMPKSTHTRRATCAEVECQHHLRGWRTSVDTDTPLGAKQANYIRLQSGRSFTVEPFLLGTVIFHFPAGQQCFTEHRVGIDRPAFYTLRDGDWRGNPTGRRLNFSSGRDWVDDFGEHQLRIKEQRERG